jgi:DNA mismatch endonuclease (patch repair protein)
MPKTRTEFWRAKFAANVARDMQDQKQLGRAGWHVLIIWECETKDLLGLESRLANAFKMLTEN